MGADFVCAVTVLKHKKNGDTYIPSEKIIKRIIKEFTPTEEELEEFIENFIHYESEEDFVISDKIAMFRERAMDMAIEFFNCIGFRDVGTIQFRTFTLVLSGGMSWGDDATDSLSIINDFNRLPWRLQEQLGAKDV